MGSSSAADIGFVHNRIGHDRLRLAVADHLAVVQHNQPPTVAHDLFEIVLDQNHGNALGVDRADDLDLSSSFARG